MSTYPNWQADLLSAIRVPNTQANRDFLTAWHAHAMSDCGLNPVDLTEKVGTMNSRDCKPASIPYRPNAHYQSYTSRLWTRTAFSAQIDSGRYPLISAALLSGAPVPSRLAAADALAKDFGRWGSVKFGNFLIDQTAAGGPPPKAKAPQALRGWGDMQRSVNHRMPAALHASARSRRAAWRALHRAGRVRL